MSWINKLKTNFTYYKYKLFPHKFNTTVKGDCLADYCKRILDEDFKDSDKISAYEEIITDIQNKTNSSRTMAVIYVLSVLSDVHQERP